MNRESLTTTIPSNSLLHFPLCHVSIQCSPPTTHPQVERAIAPSQQQKTTVPQGAKKPRLTSQPGRGNCSLITKKLTSQEQGVAVTSQRRSLGAESRRACNCFKVVSPCLVLWLQVILSIMVYLYLFTMNEFIKLQVTPVLPAAICRAVPAPLRVGHC